MKLLKSHKKTRLSKVYLKSLIVLCFQALINHLTSISSDFNVVGVEGGTTGTMTFEKCFLLEKAEVTKGIQS